MRGYGHTKVAGFWARLDEFQKRYKCAEKVVAWLRYYPHDATLDRWT